MKGANTMKKTMLTCDTLYRFEAEYVTENYTEQEIEKVEDAAYAANMNECNHPEWTEDDIFKDFLRVLKIHKIAVAKKPSTKGVNKHGIKMTNLREISGETVNNSQGYSQISYDSSTGDLLETWHVGPTGCSWTVYHDPNIIHVCNTCHHMTMQQLADAVRDALAWEAKVKGRP